LGAFYEGFKYKVEDLLLEIEAQRNQRVCVNLVSKRVSCTRMRGSRELKNLCTSINYEGSFASKRSISREMVVTFASMNLKIFSWNVRGLNDSDKRVQIRNLINLWKADVICLQNKDENHE
jgi:hypothetical protein